MRTPQLEVWTGGFGTEYTDRAVVDTQARKETFRALLEGLPVRTVLEVGCAKGDNLGALGELGYVASGVEPMAYASIQAQIQGYRVYQADCFDLPFPPHEFDLVFTAGVLMHVVPDDITLALKELWRVTREYLLVIEYYSLNEMSIEYRGHEGLLWKRDYSNLDGKLLKTGLLGRGSGFDNCTYWLFQRGE